MIKEYREEIPNKTIRTEEMEFFKMHPVNRRAEAAHTHVHEAIEIIYMNKGSVKVSIDGVKTSIYPGDIALFRSRSIHDIWTEDEVDNDYYVLKLLPRVLYNLSRNEGGSSFSLRFIVCNPAHKNVWRKAEVEGSDAELGLKRLIASLDKKKKKTTVSKIISALMVFDGLYSLDNYTEDKTALLNENLYHAIFYVNEHYAEAISAEQISDKLNMSQSSFSRGFKIATGQSFKDYLNTVRTNRAEELLLTTELSVKDVAVRCGYNNISHFISVYRKYKGKTPLAERK